MLLPKVEILWVADEWQLISTSQGKKTLDVTLRLKTWASLQSIIPPEPMHQTIGARQCFLLPCQNFYSRNFKAEFFKVEFSLVNSSVWETLFFTIKNRRRGVYLASTLHCGPLIFLMILTSTKYQIKFSLYTFAEKNIFLFFRV